MVTSLTFAIAAGALLHNGGDGTLIHRCVKLAKMNRWNYIQAIRMAATKARNP